jgi:glycosyltransferase involved in cell wall biosynthesis
MPLEGKEIWLFAAVPWDFALVGRTRCLALSLKALGARVVFVEPPSVAKSVRYLQAAPDHPPDLQLIGMPPTLRRISDGLPWLARAHDLLQRRRLQARLDGRSPVALVSWPRWAPVIEGLKLQSVWYDCIDDVAVHAGPRFERWLEWERRLLARARGAFAVTPVLAQRLRGSGAREVHLSPNAVSFEEFQRWAAPSAPKGLRKRIGYLGALYEWVDIELLEQVARSLPDHEIALVGPVRRGIEVSRLKALDNVTLWGHRPYREVPKAMASFDVALVPFREGSVARAADPIKIYEYFCFGTPVVTTPVGDVERLGDLVYVASGAEPFVAAIRAALAEDRPDLRARRIDFARENDWSERARSVAEVILEAESDCKSVPG